MKEDHDLLPIKLITDDVLNLMKPNLGRRSRNDLELTKNVINVWESIEAIEKVTLSLPEEEQAEILEKWRSIFLARLVETMRSKNLRKESLKIMFSSQIQYDSNVNRIPDNVGTPTNFSGKDDGQYLLFLNLKWQPFLGLPNFNKNWKYEQILNGVRLSQFQHKENDVSIFDTESKLTYRFRNFINSASLGWRYRNFYYSGKTNSRDTDSFFKTHRIRTELTTKPFIHNKGRLKQSQGQFSLSWQDRTPFDSSNISQDATEIKSKYEHTFSYRLAKKINASFGGSLEITDYKTERSQNFDYIYYKPSISHKHTHHWKAPFYFKEEISYRNKEWGQVFGGKLVEELISLKLQGSLQPSRKIRYTLAIKQNFKLTETTSAAGAKIDNDADQFQISFGFNWLI